MFVWLNQNWNRKPRRIYEQIKKREVKKGRKQWDVFFEQPYGDHIFVSDWSSRLCCPWIQHWISCFTNSEKASCWCFVISEPCEVEKKLKSSLMQWKKKRKLRWNIKNVNTDVHTLAMVTSIFCFHYGAMLC